MTLTMMVVFYMMRQEVVVVGRHQDSQPGFGLDFVLEYEVASEDKVKYHKQPLSATWPEKFNRF